MGLAYYQDADAQMRLKHDALVSALNEMGSKVEVVNSGSDTVTIILTTPHLSKEERWRVEEGIMLRIPLMVQEKTAMEFYAWLSANGELIFDGEEFGVEDDAKPSIEHFVGCEVWRATNAPEYAMEGMMADFVTWLPIIPEAMKAWAKDVQLKDNYNIDLSRVMSMITYVRETPFPALIDMKLEHLPGLKKTYPELVDMFKAAIDMVETFYRKELPTAIGFLETLIGRPTDNLSSVTIIDPLHQVMSVPDRKQWVNGYVTGHGVSQSTLGKHVRGTAELIEALQATISVSRELRDIFAMVTTKKPVEEYTKRYDRLLGVLKRFPELEVSDNVHNIIQNQTQYVADMIEFSGYLFALIQSSTHRLVQTQL